MVNATAPLSPEAIRERASRVRLVVTDCDGVLTDAGVYYSARGEEMKRFNVRDGMGVELLRRARVETAILTRERSECVRARAAKLELSHVWLGVHDKRAHLEAELARADIALDEVAYIGDDVNDLEVLTLVAARGLTGAPADAVPSVRAAVHFVTQERGGEGAFRAFADWLLTLLQRSAP